MSLNKTLSLFLEEYPKAKKTTFAGNAFAEFIKNDIPKAIRAQIGKNERYIIRGSAGQGNWAHVPWAAIFDRFITTSAQEGFYVVYLLKKDCSGVYISLNQGITIVRKKYGADAKHTLRVRAADFAAQLGLVKSGWFQGPIDLAVSSAAGLGTYYAQGSIYAKFYPHNNLPPDSTLNQDLLDSLDMYYVLATKEVIPQISSHREDDEEGIEYENLLLLREHKRIERNAKLIKKVKRIHGYNCQVCGMNFGLTYGHIGKDYIEAHHLTPLSKLKGTTKVLLNPKTDFAVLCANCHRMIHKTDLSGDIDSFKLHHYKKNL